MGKNKKKEDRTIEDLKYSYDKALDIFKILNDNYLKRVQIIMVALQTGLFIALMRFLSPLPDSWKDLPLPIIVTIIGFLLSRIWNQLHNKQKQYLEFMKRYLRNLECGLVDEGVPLDYFNVESIVFYPKLRDKLKALTVKFYDKEDKKIKKAVKMKKGVLVKFAEFIWSDDKYPYEKDSGKMLDGLVPLEGRLGKGTLYFWIVLFLSLIVWGIFIVCVNPPCSC